MLGLNMEVYEFHNVDAFNSEELYHITSLDLRRKFLKRECGRLNKKQKEELNALEWLFQLLDELSYD
jgi:hypothetical protein